MGHGKKSVVVCLISAVALGAVLAGCARTNSGAVVATSVNTTPASATPVNTQSSKPAPAAAGDAVPEVVVGASRGDDVEVVVKASRNNPNLVASSEHNGAH